MNTKIGMVLAALVLLLVCGQARPVFAASVDMTTQNKNADDCQQAAANNAMATAHKKITIASNAYQNMANIDAAMYNCLSKIEDAINTFVDTMDSLAATDPAHAVGIIAETAAFQVALKFIAAGCQSALADLTNIEGFALSQFNVMCVPLPNLNFKIPTLHLNKKACNGVNLLGPMINTTVPAAQQSGSWNLWGTLNRN